MTNEPTPASQPSPAAANNCPNLYRKTALVQAEQFLPAEGKIPAGVISDGHGDPRTDARFAFVLQTLEGVHHLRDGDYICTGAQGEKWNVERSIFESTYAPVEQPSPARSDMLDAERVLYVDQFAVDELAVGYFKSVCTDVYSEPGEGRVRLVLAAQATPAGGTQAERTCCDRAMSLGIPCCDTAERAPSGELSVESILEIVAENTGKRISLSNGDLDCYIAVVRAALARRATAGTTAAPTCSGCDPAEGFCKVCREAERATAGNAAPVAYADPQAFENFKHGTATKEWMWAKPDVGLVPVFAGNAPPTDARCVVCNSDAPRRGTCSTNDNPRALCNTATAAPGDLINVRRFNVYENCHVSQGHEVVPEPGGEYVRYTDVEKLLAGSATTPAPSGPPTVTLMWPPNMTQAEWDETKRDAALWHDLLRETSAQPCAYPCLRDDLTDWIATHGATGWPKPVIPNL